ncbi:MAG TPA: dihydroorotate dehydrogenase-like protein [Acidimicrobiales bacterium]|nr:dihydroorotate dehydrogenase-like protein [Acidimicrobiales bacterium]
MTATMPVSQRIDLSTSYLGLSLLSPIVASASPLTREPEQLARLAAAGVGAIVLPSLFEEEVVAEETGLSAALEAGTEIFSEALGYFPDLSGGMGVAERYLSSLERAKATLDVPVIASINATSGGAWTRYARLLGQAGADAIELNMYFVAADPGRSSADIESEQLELVSEVCRVSSVPVAVKLSPFYSAMADFAHSVVRAGAGALVLFNRFYQPDIDLEAMAVVPKVHLSSSVELGLPLRWTAILRPQLPPDVSLALTSGVHAGTDIAKAIAVGADVVMVASELLAEGPERVRSLEVGLRRWLSEHEYDSLSELRGSLSAASAERPEAFERANYMRSLRSFELLGR